MLQPGRHGNSGDYRYGFGGKEMDNEVKGEGAQYDYGFRIYDPRLGKFLSMDPLFKSFPYYTPYQFAGNKPIWATDLDGLEELVMNQSRVEQTIRIYNQNNEPIEGPVNVAYRKQGKTIREQLSSGARVLNQGYEGGPLVTEDIVLQKTSRLANGGGRIYDMTVKTKFRRATQPPPVPPYSPKDIDIPTPTPVIDIKIKDDIIPTPSTTPIAKKINSGEEVKILQGLVYPTVDANGFDFRDPGNSDFPGRSFFKDLAERLNASPEINTVKLTGTMTHGDGVSSFKVRNAAIQGLNKIRGIMKELGLTREVNFIVNPRDVKAIEDNNNVGTELVIKFEKK